MLYDKRKEQIYEYYKRFKKIDLDNIQEVNDTIVDTLLKHETEYCLSDESVIIEVINQMLDDYQF